MTNSTAARSFKAKVPFCRRQSEDDITARVQTQEHAIYPLVISWFAQRLKMRDNAASVDGRRLRPQVSGASDE